MVSALQRIKIGNMACDYFGLLDKVKFKQNQNYKKETDTKIRGKNFLCRGDKNSSQVRISWGGLRNVAGCMLGA